MYSLIICYVSKIIMVQLLNTIILYHNSILLQGEQNLIKSLNIQRNHNNNQLNV